MKRTFALVGLLAAIAASPAAACSLCEGRGFLATPTLRQEAGQPVAVVILHGTIANPTFDNEGRGGRTDFVVKTVLRESKSLKAPAKLVLSRYLPVDDPKNPPHYLLFCDVDGKRLDPYRGVPLTGGLKSLEYVKKALKADPKRPAESLAFFFDHLDDPDPEVARDAFSEFARAGDADVLKAASKLDAAKLRGWIKDPKTPIGRLSVYALLLGACGKQQDAKLLRDLLDSKEERETGASDGILAGYVQLKPKEGWELARALLADGRKPLLTRIGALRTIRFYHGAQPKESRPYALKALRAALTQGELADLAIDDLRSRQEWELTDDVLKCYGRKGYDAPLMKRAILRYALSCPPSKETKDFLAARRAEDSEMVSEVEAGLRLEKK
jgi:hypothetical protein